MSDTTVYGSGSGPRNEPTPVEQMSYEEARDELVEVVRILELGQMGLDESLSYWERGEALARRCEEHLDRATQRVERTLGTQGESEGVAAASATGAPEHPAAER